MGIAVERFGRRIESHKLKFGQLAICRIPAIGDYLIMRVDIDGPGRYDLFLLTIGGGKAPDRAYPFVRPSSGHYISVEGSFKARPVADIPLPGDHGPGALVIAPDGRAFLHVVDDNDAYLALDTFKSARPGLDCEYFPNWELVLSNGDDERVVGSFPSKSSLGVWSDLT